MQKNMTYNFKNAIIRKPNKSIQNGLSSKNLHPQYEIIVEEHTNYIKAINDTGLKINLITGLKEAKIIAKGNRLSKLDYNKTYLYVDVGGGSTEYSILKKGVNKKSKSFKFGTVRLLNKLDVSHTKNEIDSSR